MQPYYADPGIELYCGECLDVLESMQLGKVPPTTITALDVVGRIHVITDPPYSKQTHDGARGGGFDQNLLLTAFDATTPEAIGKVLSACCATGWVLLTCDWRHVHHLMTEPPDGLKFIRVGCWTKPDGAPQFTGDRPGSGWEPVIILHTADYTGKMRWNGGGHHAVWRFGVERNVPGHPTPKPLGLVSQWVRDFTDPGELVIDPFAGSGTTLRACKDLGRRCIGIELNPEYCEIAKQRLAQEVLIA